jgi:pantetheine-phosphate adenylyltransferase
VGVRKAVVPGTFDPITSGHLEIIERAHALFDELVVGVASSWSKRGVGTLFTLDERVELAREATAHLENIQIMPFEGMLIDFVHSQNAQAIVKGLRAMTDFENEFQMAAINWKLDAQIETVFVMASPDHMYLSSSTVNEIASLKGPLLGLVPPNVEEPLRMKYS